MVRPQDGKTYEKYTLNYAVYRILFFIVYMYLFLSHIFIYFLIYRKITLLTARKNMALIVMISPLKDYGAILIGLRLDIIGVGE